MIDTASEALGHHAERAVGQRLHTLRMEVFVKI